MRLPNDLRRLPSNLHQLPNSLHRILGKNNSFLMCGKLYIDLCMVFLCPGKAVLFRIPLFFGQYSGSRFILPPLKNGEY